MKFTSMLDSNLKISVTGMTQIFAINQAMVDLGYASAGKKALSYMEPGERSGSPELLESETPVLEAPETLHEKQFKIAYYIAHEYHFEAFKLGGARNTTLTCPLLGIARVVSRSWTKINLKDKLSVED